MEMLEMRNTATEMKNVFVGPTALDDSVIQLRKGARSMETTQTKTQRRKDKPTEQGIQELWGDYPMAKCTCHRSIEKGK